MRICIAACVVVAACTGSQGPQGPAGAMGDMGTAGSAGSAGAPGPGHVVKDATGAVIPGSFWSIDAVQGVAMGYLDADGNLWRLDPWSGGAAELGPALGTQMKVFTATDCTSMPYYLISTLPPPHVTFVDGLASKTLPTTTVGTTLTIGSYVKSGGSCTAFSISQAGLIAQSTIDALPSLTAPSLGAQAPLTPAIAP